MPVGWPERPCEMAALLGVRTNPKRHQRFSSMSWPLEGEAAMTRMPKYAKAIAVIAGCVFLSWCGSACVGVVELYAKQKADWLSACQADGNKPYQCQERWEHMQRGGE